MDASEIGVVFDCDGTLLDSMGVWHGLQNELAERAGGTLTVDDVAALAPMSIPECGAFFHEKFGLGESDREVVGMIDEYMLDFYRHRAEPRPGAFDGGFFEPQAVSDGRHRALRVCPVSRARLVGRGRAFHEARARRMGPRP